MDPKQLVLVVFVVREALFIDSENVMAIDVLTDTDTSELLGEEDETVGAVVSDWLPVLNPSSVVL